MAYRSGVGRPVDKAGFVVSLGWGKIMVLTGISRVPAIIVQSRRAFGGSLLFVAAALLAAVLTPAPAVLAQTSDAAAPGNVSDITKILDQDRPDAKRSEDVGIRADAQPPAGASGSELVKFYYKRAGAAAEKGRVKQWIADLEQASELAEKHGGPTNNIARDLVAAHLAAGNLRDSVAAARARWEGVRNERKGGKKLSALSILVRTLISAGHVGEAKKFLDIMHKIEDNLPARMPADRRIGLHGFVADAEARFFILTGKGKKAEKALNEAIEGTRQLLERNAGDESTIRVLNNKLSGQQRTLAKQMMRMGRLKEAEVLAREVLTRTLTQRGKYSPTTARSIIVLQNVIFSQGRFIEAEALARSAEEILETAGLSPQSVNLLSARISVAKNQAALGQWQKAGAIIDRVEKDIAGDPQVYKRTLGKTPEAILIRYRNGQTEQGLDAARMLVDERVERYGEKHGRSAEAYGFRAMGLVAAGQHEKALADFRKAIPILLSGSRQVDTEDTINRARDLRRKAIFDSYVGLLNWIFENRREAEPGFEIAAEAFLISDAGRGGSVKRAVAQSSARAAARDPELARLVREEQDMLREIGALFGLLTAQQSAPADQRDEDVAEELRSEIDRLRGARAEIREELERRFPDYIRLIDPRPAGLEQVREAMADNESILTTYVTDEKTFVWAFGKTGPVGFASAPVGREQLGAAAAQLRRALDPAAVTLDDIPEFDIALAHRLYASLLEPVAQGWKERSQLIVVADGPLGQVPFSLLPTRAAVLGQDTAAPFDRYRKVAWLARSHAVTVMPAVSSLIALRALPSASDTPRNFVGFGDPIFNADQLAQAPADSTVGLTSRGALKTRGVPIRLRNLPKTRGVDSAELGILPRLPDTDAEIRTMAKAMQADMARDVFIGKQANEKSVREAGLDQYRVVAFATHGLVPGDLSGLLEPALALTAPAIAGITDSDGLLTMGEIFELRLNADWVVLSACNTGTAAGAGAEAVSGLGRAFFYAGTRALLVSNWPVETTSARALTTDVFARQAADPKLPRAEALRQARIALIDGAGFVDPKTNNTVFSYAHPIFWAPFTLIGDGGGRRS